MKSKVISRIPETECYVCGSTAIKQVCHHCGRAMCSEHGPFTLPPDRRFYRIENLEYAELLTEDVERRVGEEGIHCEHCRHYVGSYEPLLYIFISAGSLSILGGLLSSQIESVIGLLLWGITVITISVGIIYIDRRDRFHAMLAHRPLLPVWGRFPSIAVHEFVKGVMTLDGTGLYASRDTQTKGVINFKLQLSPEDKERLKKYRQKYLLNDQSDIPFHVGFAVLREAQRLQPSDWDKQDIGPIVLTGNTASQTFFSQTSSPDDRYWSLDYKYNFILDVHATSKLPVHIVPTLLSEGDEWALELYVQVNPSVDTSSLSNPVIEELELEVPNILDGIQSHAPSASVKEGDNIYVNWRNIYLQKNRDDVTYNASLYVRFKNNKSISSGLSVHGMLSLKFNGAVSKLNRILWFSPLGDRRDDKGLTIIKNTHMTLDFHFQLDCLHVRKLEIISESVDQLTTIPESEMITRLVNVMSNNEMYVQRVIENPPTMNRANAQMMNRLWVIGGRRYEQATPIDFRIVAIGQEQYDDSDKPYGGKTKFEIATQGAIINKRMASAIRTLSNQLIASITHRPIFKIELNEKQFHMDEWDKLEGTITNSGEVSAQDVIISVTHIKAGEPDRVHKIVQGDSWDFALNVYPKTKGRVPITITVACKDQFGNCPPTTKECQILVEEIVVPSTVINNAYNNQNTHFSASTTGPIHTGSGNIVVNDKW